MSSTEPTTTYGETSGTPQTRDDASSAAERLGGPMEDEQGPDTARRAETAADRQTETVAREGEQSVDTARRAETDADRQSDAAAEGEQSVDTMGQAEIGADRQADAAAVRRSADTARQAETDADRQGDTGAGQRTTLIAAESAESYNSRWNELKSDFVDEPRRAVRGANELVGEVLDELEELFRRQRADLEHGLDSEETTTEDLRLALGRYRSFFDRLLSF
jgi:hypothetical protein